MLVAIVMLVLTATACAPHYYVPLCTVTPSHAQDETKQMVHFPCVGYSDGLNIGVSRRLHPTTERYVFRAIIAVNKQGRLTMIPVEEDE